ncbi:hypothetical protein N0V93_008451 [Gnomoniopsis smithogilvyi]|uniref:Uncharacterized protein n=1 Tax=Gnomoniopsis smithogilvyi TaxID=1191159 RepID=A0A9W8YP64_9PEZI|nr:hypothetical protein N0V93_008451 [Gnomoniopsis smithogilvyi]
MPIHPRVNQRVAREKFCKTCMIQLAVSGILSYGMLHELWISPLPKNNVGKVFKHGLCVFSVLPVMTFFLECCVDPVYCDPVHGHLWALRARDMVVGMLYWGIGFWLPADVVEEADRDMRRDLEMAQRVQETDEPDID